MSSALVSFFWHIKGPTGAREDATRGKRSKGGSSPPEGARGAAKEVIEQLTALRSLTVTNTPVVSSCACV